MTTGNILAFHRSQPYASDAFLPLCRRPRFPTAQDVRTCSSETLTATTSARTLFKWCGRSRCWAL